MSKKVIVIGAGLAGVQTAWFLHGEGMDVTVIDRCIGPAMETSFANGGLITPSHAVPWNSPGTFRVLLASIGNPAGAIYVTPSAIPQYVGWGLKYIRNSTHRRFRQTIERNSRLATYSLEQFGGIKEQLKLKFDHGSLGTLMVYRSQAALDRAQAANQIVANTGISVELCSASELVKIEPALADIKDQLSGGFFYKGDEHGDAQQYCEGLSEQLNANGVDMRFGESVIDFECSGGRINGVITDKARYAADAVVLAAGMWSTELGRKLGLRLPIKPVKGYSVTYDVSGWNGMPKIPVVDDEQHIGLTPLGNRMRFVGTAEFSGYSPEINPTRVENLCRAALATFPSITPLVEDVEPLNTWCGHRPMTPDCLPIVGQSGPANLYLNTGHCYLGWTTACGTSRAISDQIAGRKPSVNLADYGPDRF